MTSPPQAVAFFLEKDRLKNLLEPLEAAAALISAAAHDIDHPGFSSAFLCNSRHSLALLYNDVCVLESHHAALTFKLTLSECFFCNFCCAFFFSVFIS